MSRILISLSNGKPSRVLNTIISTINSDNPGAGTPGTYTDSSCYGAVAHYLRDHWDDSWHILMFGHADNVFHCCLFDNKGNVVKDSLTPGQGKGNLVTDPKPGYYTPKTGEVLPFMKSFTLASIRSKIERL